MIIASESALPASEPVTTCPRDGAAYLPSQGCGICAFDARYDVEPLGHCSECGAGLSGRENACGVCLHAALLAEAQASVSRFVPAGGSTSADAVMAFASQALAGSSTAEDGNRLAGRLLTC